MSSFFFQLSAGSTLMLSLLFGSHSAMASETWQEPITGMVFAAIPGGCYQMGNPDALNPERADYQRRQLGYKDFRFADEAPVHKVCLDPFWIGETEVTARQWLAVTGSPSPAGLDQQPASGISWRQAQRFAQQLTLLSEGGYLYRLPTEAEWEYACLAGGEAANASQDPGSATRERVAGRAWYSLPGRRILQPSPVAMLDPNPWGLKDMLGNVWEWTADSYSKEAYLQHALNNPHIEQAGGNRVIRGASYRSDWKEVRCASRGDYPAELGLGHIGFRLVRVEKP